MGRNKSKAAPGTWITREMSTSQAYCALSGSAKGMLVMFLLKRDMNKRHEVLNRQNITLTYKELENIFGPDAFGRPQGLSRGSITRGIKDLLAKGFIEIVEQGGAYQKHKTIYGLTDDWKWWNSGTVIRKKEKGRSSGHFALQQKSKPPQP